MNFDTKCLEPWEKIIPCFSYNSEIPFFEMLVPTTDTVRYGYLMEKLLSVNHSVLFTGITGVGKVRHACLSFSIVHHYKLFTRLIVHFSLWWHGHCWTVCRRRQVMYPSTSTSQPKLHQLELKRSLSQNWRRRERIYLVRDIRYDLGGCINRHTENHHPSCKKKSICVFMYFRCSS